MVCRDSIKALELKTKALPLFISLLLHGVIVFAIGTVKHSGKRVFMVELMLQNAGKQYKAIGPDKLHRDRSIVQNAAEIRRQHPDNMGRSVQNRESITHGAEEQIATEKESNVLSTDNEGHAHTLANTVSAPTGRTGEGYNPPSPPPL